MDPAYSSCDYDDESCEYVDGWCILICETVSTNAPTTESIPNVVDTTTTSSMRIPQRTWTTTMQIETTNLESTPSETQIISIPTTERRTTSIIDSTIESQTEGFTLLRENTKCVCAGANETLLGVFEFVEGCAESCRQKNGCKTFIYGKQSKRGRCFDEGITEEACAEWETDQYDFYKLNDVRLTSTIPTTSIIETSQTEDAVDSTTETSPTEDAADSTTETLPTEDAADSTIETSPTEDATDSTTETLPTEDIQREQLSLVLDVVGVDDSNLSQICDSVATELQGDVVYCSTEESSEEQRNLQEKKKLYMEMMVVDILEATTKISSPRFIESLENLPDNVTVFETYINANCICEFVDEDDFFPDNEKDKYEKLENCRRFSDAETCNKQKFCSWPCKPTVMPTLRPTTSQNKDETTMTPVMSPTPSPNLLPTNQPHVCITKNKIPENATSLVGDTKIVFSTPCMFPFEYKDTTYSSCTNVVEDDPNNYWCNTNTGGTEWGYCDSETCKLEEIGRKRTEQENVKCTHSIARENKNCPQCKPEEGARCNGNIILVGVVDKDSSECCLKPCVTICQEVSEAISFEGSFQEIIDDDETKEQFLEECTERFLSISVACVDVQPSIIVTFVGNAKGIEIMKKDVEKEGLILTSFGSFEVKNNTSTTSSSPNNTSTLSPSIHSTQNKTLEVRENETYEGDSGEEEEEENEISDVNDEANDDNEGFKGWGWIVLFTPILFICFLCIILMCYKSKSEGPDGVGDKQLKMEEGEKYLEDLEEKGEELVEVEVSEYDSSEQLAKSSLNTAESEQKAYEDAFDNVIEEMSFYGDSTLDLELFEENFLARSTVNQDKL